MHYSDKYIEILTGLVNHKNLDVNQKKDLLQKIKDYFCEQWNMSKANINVRLIFEPLAQSQGHFQDEDRTICLHANHFQSHFLKSIDTLLHELRHSYQFYIVNKKPENECDELEKMLRINSSNYNRVPTSHERELEDDIFNITCKDLAYSNNAVEIDARNYANETIFAMISDAEQYFKTSYTNIYDEIGEELDHNEKVVRQVEEFVKRTINYYVEDLNTKTAHLWHDIKDYRSNEKEYIEIANFRSIVEKYDFDVNMDFFKAMNPIFKRLEGDYETCKSLSPYFVKAFKESAFENQYFFDNFVLTNFDKYTDEIASYCKNKNGSKICDKLIEPLKNRCSEINISPSIENIVTQLFINKNIPTTFKSKFMTELLSIGKNGNEILSSIISRYDCSLELRRAIQVVLIEQELKLEKEATVNNYDLSQRIIFYLKQKNIADLILQNANFPNNDCQERNEALAFLINKQYFSHAMDLMLKGNIDESFANEILAKLKNDNHYIKLFSSCEPVYVNGILKSLKFQNRQEPLYSIAEIFFMDHLDDYVYNIVLQEASPKDYYKFVHVAINKNCGEENKQKIIEYFMHKKKYEICAEILVRNGLLKSQEDIIFNAIVNEESDTIALIINILVDGGLKNETRQRLTKILKNGQKYYTICKLASDERCDQKQKDDIIDFLFDRKQIMIIENEFFISNIDYKTGIRIFQKCLENGYGEQAVHLPEIINEIGDISKEYYYDRIAKDAKLGPIVLLQYYCSSPNSELLASILKTNLSDAIKNQLQELSIERGNLFCSEKSGQIISSYKEFFEILEAKEKNELAIQEMNYYTCEGKLTPAFEFGVNGINNIEDLLKDKDVELKHKIGILELYLRCNMYEQIMKLFRTLSINDSLNKIIINKIRENPIAHEGLLFEIIQNAKCNMNLRFEAIEILSNSLQFNTLECILSVSNLNYGIVEEKILSELVCHEEIERLQNIILEQSSNEHNLITIIEMCFKLRNIPAILMLRESIYNTKKVFIDCATNGLIKNLIDERDTSKLRTICNLRILPNEAQIKLKNIINDMPISKGKHI